MIPSIIIVQTERVNIKTFIKSIKHYSVETDSFNPTHKLGEDAAGVGF